MAENKHHVGALSPEMALLGLLYAGPSYGYDLHKKVSGELSHVWHLSQSQAYAILKRLEKQGKVTTQELRQDRLPSRQLLRLTPAGREHFLRWIDASSSGSIREIRLEFITRVYFAKSYFPGKLPELFTRQRNSAAFHIARLEMMIAEQGTDDLFDRMSLTLRLYHLQNILLWLDVFAAEIVNGSAIPPK